MTIAVGFGIWRSGGPENGRSSSVPTGTIPEQSATSAGTVKAVVEPYLPPPHPVSLAALMEQEFNGSALTLGRVLSTTSSYRRHYITYRSGDLTISGIMNIPHGDGPFPALILNHGHIDTSVYTNGRGLRREQDYLARQGYIVLHPDYRNHADSSKDDRDQLIVRLGYVEDVINAVYALRRAELPVADPERIGMLGHSMGGGITLSVLVTQPELVDAAVLYAPVSGDMRDSYRRWIERRPEAASRIRELYGDPETAPTFWDGLAAEHYYDRVKAPVAMFHGTADSSVPVTWSEETKSLLEQAVVDVSLTVYDGEAHEFGPRWSTFMRSVKTFFDKNI